MSVSTNVVKITAKTALNGKLTKAVTAGVIAIFLFLICQFSASLLSNVIGEIWTEILFNFLLVFLIFPVGLGLLKFYWRILFSADDNPVYVFYWFSSFKKYKKCIKFILHFIFYIVLWLVIFNVPAFLLKLFSNDAFFELIGVPMPIWMANLTYYTTFIQFVAYFLTFILTLKYYLAPVLFVADDDIDTDEAMHMSSVISKKTSIDFISLIFSNFGWILLSFLILPLFFTLPYLMVRYLVHVRFSVAEYNLHIKQTEKQLFWQV